MRISGTGGGPRLPHPHFGEIDMTFLRGRYYLSKAMSYVTLNKVEIAVLKNSVRRGDSDPGFHELLVTLDRQLDENTGQLYVSEQTREMIVRYGSGKLSWHGLLFAVLGRTLGDSINRKRQ